MRSLALTALAVLLLALPAEGALQRQIIGAEQDHSLAEATDCDHFYKTTFTSFAAQVHDQEQREVALTGVKLLKIRASEEGGVSIRGWDKPFARLVICKYAGAQTRAQAQRALTAISVPFANGDLTVQGPPMDQTQVWWVNMILYVPKKAEVEVLSQNGGIAIRNMSGKVTARATNGGISIAQSSGDFRITTESGGVTLDRVTGKIEAATQNGPIALKVKDGKAPPALEARTERDGDIVCNLKACDASRGLRELKVLRIGTAVPVIRLVTVSAPIIIDEARKRG
ncbi:MAG TPA: hypothetical protein VGF48_05325 [Thermoanaerobaculia bacterium]|jgi:hypothetical protein